MHTLIWTMFILELNPQKWIDVHFGTQRK